MTWQDRPVFVTGCTGLIGAWLTKELVEKGARVVGLIRDTVPRTTFTEWGLAARITTVRGDVSDLGLLTRILHEYSIDTVFHLAAQAAVPVASKNPYLTFESNIRGTYTLLEACRRAGPTRIIVASSDKAYGDQAILPYTEDAPLHGDYPYDVSKSCVDLLAQSYWKTYQLPVCITRCANMFGPGDLQWTRIVPRTIRLALRNEAPTIRSDGFYQRDYCYVRNIADAYLTLAENMSSGFQHYGHAFNFGSETPLTVFELVQAILDKMGKGHLLPQVRNTATGEIKHQWLDASKAHRILNWHPMYTLEEGLEATIAWYTHYLLKESVYAGTT